MSERDNIIALLRSMPVMYANFPIESSKWDYEFIKAQHWKSLDQSLSIDTYLAVYECLTMEEINSPVFNGIILIALELQDSEGRPVFQPEINPTTGTIEGEADIKSSFPKYDAAEIVKILKFERNKSVSELPAKENDFKTYMRHFCVLLLRLMFKNCNNLNTKADEISKGLKLLGINYTGDLNLIKMTNDLRKNLRIIAENCLYKLCTANTIVRSYIYHKFNKHNRTTNFLSWSLTTATHLMGFGVLKHIITCSELFNDEMKHFLLRVSCSDSTRSEIKRLESALNYIIEEPKDDEEREKWMWYKYSGMFSNEYHGGFRYKYNPYLTSVVLGILNGVNTNKNEPITFKSFPRTAYKINFYNWGYQLSQSIQK